jgi:hypothetical protein
MVTLLVIAVLSYFYPNQNPMHVDMYASSVNRLHMNVHCVCGNIPPAPPLSSSLQLSP